MAAVMKRCQSRRGRGGTGDLGWLVPTVLGHGSRAGGNHQHRLRVPTVQRDRQSANRGAVAPVTDDVCVVQVGVHPRPCWRDKNSGLVVCSRHRSHYEERANEFGPFDWEECAG